MFHLYVKIHNKIKRVFVEIQENFIHYPERFKKLTSSFKNFLIEYKKSSGAIAASFLVPNFNGKFLVASQTFSPMLWALLLGLDFRSDHIRSFGILYLILYSYLL